MKDFLTGSGVTRRISCSQSVVIGIWMWPLSKTFLCTLLAEALCSPLLEVYNAGVVLLCHLLASAPRPSASIFFFMYLASFMYQTQNFFCKTRACRLPPCLHLESCSLTDPTKVPKCVSKQRFGTFRLKHFATRRLMLFLVLFQEASSSVYRGNKQHGSVPRSSLQNTARVTKHGLLAL